jgi:hypothetical protein
VNGVDALVRKEANTHSSTMQARRGANDAITRACKVLLFSSLLLPIAGQFLESDPRYTLKKAEMQEAQQDMLKTHPEIVMSYTPGIKVG